jgi:hypothetical protein
MNGSEPPDPIIAYADNSADFELDEVPTDLVGTLRCEPHLGRPVGRDGVPCVQIAPACPAADAVFGITGSISLAAILSRGFSLTFR